MNEILSNIISIKLLWWNVFGPHPNLEHADLYSNLTKISLEHSVLFIGEFNPQEFSQNEKSKLLKTHSNFYFFKHKIRPDGIAIFSKDPLKIKQTYFKTSESFYLETEILNKKILITHLRHNWHTIREKWGLLGLPYIVSGNMFNTGSMVNKQTLELLKVISDTDVIIGDFNTFPSFLGKKSHLYSKFNKIGFIDNIKETTWPNPKVDFIKYPSLTLDQVFSKTKINSKKMELDGSDHYPISIELNTNSSK